MNKVNYAFAMLTAAGGAIALSPAAHAETLYGSFTNIYTGYAETFQLQSDGGVADATPGFTDFALTDDSLGNTLAIAGDNTTGFKATVFKDPVDSYFGTGPSDSTPEVGQTSDSFKPPLYMAPQSPGVLQPGTYYGDIFFPGGTDSARALASDDFPPDFDGAILVLSTSAVPEPEAWALLIAGAAMAGGGIRASRKRALASA